MLRSAAGSTALLLLLTACGGDDGRAPDPVPSATAPPPTLLAATSPADGIVAGAATVGFEWTEAAPPSGAYAVDLERGDLDAGTWSAIPAGTSDYGSCSGRVRVARCTAGPLPVGVPLRWRVTSEDATGRATATTDWRTLLVKPGGAGTRFAWFRFELPAGSSQSVTAGPIQVGAGAVEVTLSFGGSFVILACAGSPTQCTPFGGRPATASFQVPAQYPAGPFRAAVYFNPNFAQPPGNAVGSVMFVFTP